MKPRIDHVAEMDELKIPWAFEAPRYAPMTEEQSKGYACSMAGCGCTEGCVNAQLGFFPHYPGQPPLVPDDVFTADAIARTRQTFYGPPKPPERDEVDLATVCLGIAAGLVLIAVIAHLMGVM